MITTPYIPFRERHAIFGLGDTIQCLIELIKVITRYRCLTYNATYVGENDLSYSFMNRIMSISRWWFEVCFLLLNTILQVISIFRSVRVSLTVHAYRLCISLCSLRISPSPSCLSVCPSTCPFACLSLSLSSPSAISSPPSAYPYV